MKRLRCVGCAAVFFCSIASAQTSPKPSAADEPLPISREVTIKAAFGDWILKCNYEESSGHRARICEISQTITMRGQAVPFAQIAIGRIAPADPVKLTVVLPHNISFDSSVRLAIDENDTTPIDLVWRRCLPGGCYANADLRSDQVGRWLSQTDEGLIQFKDAVGQKINLRFSFRGFARSLSVLDMTSSITGRLTKYDPSAGDANP